MRELFSSRALAVALAAGVLVSPIALQAQSLNEFHNMSREERRAYMESLSEQERQAKREQWRAERDAMSDDERAAALFVCARPVVARPARSKSTTTT